MQASTMLTIIGIVLSVLGTWGLFFLSQIKNAQVDTNEEIKEMNKDIRDILVNQGKHGEQVMSLSQRILILNDHINSIEGRVLKLEQTDV